MPIKDDEVIVGQKEPIAYCTAILTLKKKGMENITVKARGKNISSAVEVVQIVRRRFLDSVEVKSVKIDSNFNEGNIVPLIEICLKI